MEASSSRLFRVVLPEASLLCMQLTNPASAASVQMTEHTRYVAPWSPSWPTITIEPNATVCTPIHPSLHAFSVSVSLVIDTANAWDRTNVQGLI